MRYQTMAIVAVLAAAALPASAGTGEDRFPARPVTLVVPFAAGGATDVIARTVAQNLSEQWGQPVIVENRAGGNGNIGASAVAQSKEGGYTLLMATSSHAINASLYKHLNYKLAKDLTALSLAASVPLMLVVHPDVPARTPKELSAYGRANAGKLNFASGGIGTASHLAGELFNTASNAQMVHVAYKGGAPATTDLIGGQTQVMFANLPEVLAHVRAGKLRALAVTGDKRHPQQPAVPTFRESGFDGMELKSWFGFFAPANTPKPVAAKISGDIVKAVASPNVQTRIRELGGEPIGMAQAEFQVFVEQEIERWGAIVKQSNATVD